MRSPRLGEFCISENTLRAVRYINCEIPAISTVTFEKFDTPVFDINRFHCTVTPGYIEQFGDLNRVRYSWQFNICTKKSPKPVANSCRERDIVTYHRSSETAKQVTPFTRARKIRSSTGGPTAVTDKSLETPEAVLAPPRDRCLLRPSGHGRQGDCGHRYFSA